MGDFERSLALGKETEHRARELDRSMTRSLWLNNIGLVLLPNGSTFDREEYTDSLSTWLRKMIRPTGHRLADNLAFTSVQNGRLIEAQAIQRASFKTSSRQKRPDFRTLPSSRQGPVAAGRGDQTKPSTSSARSQTTRRAIFPCAGKRKTILAELYEADHRVAEADKQYQRALGHHRAIACHAAA